MVAKKLSNPPVLTGVDSTDSLLQDLDIRKCVTDFKKKQQGLVIYCHFLRKFPERQLILLMRNLSCPNVLPK